MAVLFSCMFLLLVMGVRIAYAIGLSSMIYIVFCTDISIMTVAQQISSGSDSIVMVALPFFLLVGQLMNAGGITDRLVRFSMAMLGGVKGGLSFVVVISNMIMAAISGAAIASGAAVGSVMIPAMEKKGYSKGFAGAINAAAATIGPVIPPSVGFIIYASVSHTSVVKLFIAGTVPGLILGIFMIGICYIISHKRNLPAGESHNKKEIISSFKGATWGLLMPVIIIGGIMSGIVTATEASVIAVVYGLIISLFVYKTIKFSQLPRIFAETAKQTARIMLIIASASAFGWIISRQVEPRVFVDTVTSITQSSTIFMLLIILVILIFGMVMEGGSIMIILTPLLLPVLNQFNINLIHFGVVFQLAIMVGLLTPPVGILLFVVSGAGNVNIKDILKNIWPFYLVIVFVILLVTFIPGLSLWLVNILNVKA
jgi:tripartite ATP-independent transporter DctM subunit